jgi:hypothetical protein
MNENPAPSSHLSLDLSGKMLQFNITVLVLGLCNLCVFWISSKSTNILICYGGSAVALLGFLAIFALVVSFYSKQKSRPTDGQAVTISMQNQAGEQISFQNPPDSVFEKGEIISLARSMLVGYDENLCADGQVVGKSSEENYRRYSDEEKMQFKNRHREEIRGKKAQAARLLAENEAPVNQIIPNVTPAVVPDSPSA